MTQAIAPIARLAYAVGSAAGQPFQIDAEYQHQEHPQPEGRGVKSDRAQAAQQAVGPGILETGADQGHAHGQNKHQGVGQAAQNQRIADQRRYHVQDGALVFEGNAEVAPDDIAQPCAVLASDGAVQTQAVAGCLQFGGRHGGHGVAVERLQGIARRQARNVEHDDGQREQHGHEEQRLAGE